MNSAVTSEKTVQEYKILKIYFICPPPFERVRSSDMPLACRWGWE